MKTLLKILTIVILPLALLGFILFSNARSDAELPILEVDNEAYNRYLKGGDIFSSMADDPSDRLRDSLTCYLDRTQIFADEGKIDQNTVATPHYQSLINGFAKVVLNRADSYLRSNDDGSSDRRREIRENLNTIERQRQSYGVSLDQSEASRYNSVHIALNLYVHALGWINAARSTYINQLEDYPSILAPISSCISDCEANEYVKASGVISSLKDAKSNLVNDYRKSVTSRCNTLLDRMIDPKVIYDERWKTWRNDSERVSENKKLHNEIVSLVNTYRKATGDTSLNHFTTERQDWWTY